MKRQKKRFRKIGIILFIYFVYFIVGAVAPFVVTKDVSPEFKEQFMAEQFLGDGVSVDRASIVEDGQEALDTRIKMINEAKKRIILVSYAINNDRSCYDIFSAIQEAANRGVQIQILVDGFSGSYEMAYDPIYYSLGTQSSVEIRYYNMPNLLKPWTFNSRLHDKYMLVDDKLLLLGGRNTNNYFLGEYDPKHLSYDRDILVYNTAEGTSKTGKSVINEVVSYFQKTWDSQYSKVYYDKIPFWKKEKTKEAKAALTTHYNELKIQQPQLFTLKTDYNSETYPVNKISLIHNPSGILGKEPWVWYQINQLMKTAQKQIYIHTPYVVLNTPMYQDLTALSQQALDCTILLNSVAGGDNFVASSDYVFNRDKVLATKARILEFQGMQSSHGKSISIDDNLSIIGSYNLDMRSTYINSEVMLVVDSMELNAQLQRNIRQIESQSLEVNPDGTYKTKENVIPLEITKSKAVLYSITSVLFQLIRFLS